MRASAVRGYCFRAKDGKRQKRQGLDVLAVFPILPSATSCTYLHLQGRQIGLFNSGSPKSVSFLGRGERNGAFIINFVEINSNTEFQSGSPKSVSFLGKRRKEWSVYYKFRRNLFKHGISFDVVGATIGRPFYFL